MLSDNRIIYNYFTNVLSWIVVTIVFGGIDPESKVELNTSAFEKLFSRKRNLASWESRGTSLCTSACSDGHNQFHR